MPEFKIEKNVEMPKHKTNNKYPFREMEIGDSFFASCVDADKHKMGVNIISNAGRLKPKKFRTLQVDGGIRCWRIE